ncbi:MAG: hypothetical protein QXW80_01650 [Candidatus Micrarchaeia archaeon]
MKKGFKHILYLALLLLIILLNPVHAQTNTNQDNVPNGCEVALLLDFGNQSNSAIGVEQNWKSLSFIGLLVSLFLLIFAYLIGKSLDSPQLIARAKTDMIQVVVTAIMLGVLYSILLFICSIDASQFGFNFTSFFDGARMYLEYSRASALNAYLKCTNAMMIITGLSTFNINNPNFIDLGAFLHIGVYFKPFAGYGITIGALNWFSSLVQLSYSLITGYIVVLDAIQLYFLNLLLPAGVVLRCFSPTRDLGGVLIAISVGLFFFYPLLFSFSYMIIGQPDPNVRLPDMDWESEINSAVAKSVALSSVPLGSLVTIFNSLFGKGGEAIDRLNEAYIATGSVILYVFILPAINWIILVAIIRELSKALGQEVDISGLARMI